VEFCDRARRRFYLSPSYVLGKMLQSFRDPRELQRNLKGFATLSKYLLRGSFGGSSPASVSRPAA
jgi:anaerobic magnesium-protoporphyrin IX monomethyl ester cyclase